MGFFDKKMNKEGAIAGMIIGLLLMLFYMLKFKFGLLMVERCCCWLKRKLVVRISPEGFGTIAMIVNFVVAFTVKVLHRSLPRCSRYCGTH
jgi:cation/acetate symporter